jgi:hypothetical protein
MEDMIKKYFFYLKKGLKLQVISMITMIIWLLLVILLGGLDRRWNLDFKSYIHSPMFFLVAIPFSGWLLVMFEPAGDKSSKSDIKPPAQQ